jgi:hypothetical protein
MRYGVFSDAAMVKRSLKIESIASFYTAWVGSGRYHSARDNFIHPPLGCRHEYFLV